jgi:DNA (cytosine-5)-methyltransferase 1
MKSRQVISQESARLVGLSDDYLLPTRYNDAYRVCEDGVGAPMVRHIAECILEPLLSAKSKAEPIAAE